MPLLDSIVVDMERLIAALAPAQVVARAPAEILDLAYDARAVAARGALLLRAGERATGTTSPPRRSRTARSRSSSSGRSTCQSRSSSSRTRGAAMAVAADVFFGRPTTELHGRRRDRHEREDDDRVPALRRARGRRPPARAARDGRDAASAASAARRAHDAGGDRPPAARSARCSTRATAAARWRRPRTGRRCGRLDRRPLRRARLHEPEPGPPRLPPRRWRTTSRPSAACSSEASAPPAAVNVGDEYGRRLADELARRDAAVTFGFAGTPTSAPRARALGAGHASRGRHRAPTRLRGRFNVENVLGAVAAAQLLGIAGRCGRRGDRVASRGVPGRFEPVDEGQPFTVVVDYAHKPDALENVLRAARELTGGRVLCVFGCGGDRDAGKRPQMGRIASELADVADPHVRQPAQRGPGGDRRRGAGRA